MLAESFDLHEQVRARAAQGRRFRRASDRLHPVSVFDGIRNRSHIDWRPARGGVRLPAETIGRFSSKGTLCDQTRLLVSLDDNLKLTRVRQERLRETINLSRKALAQSDNTWTAFPKGASAECGRNSVDLDSVVIKWC